MFCTEVYVNDFLLHGTLYKPHAAQVDKLLLKQCKITDYSHCICFNTVKVAGHATKAKGEVEM
jgi:hypothetical protein